MIFVANLPSSGHPSPVSGKWTVHRSTFLCFIGYPVIIKHGIGRFLCSEFSLYPHSDIGFSVKQVTLGDRGKSWKLHIDLLIRSGKLNSRSGIDHFGECVDLSNHRIGQCFPYHLRMAIRAVSPWRNPETFFRTLLVWTTSGHQSSFLEAFKERR